MLDFKCLTALLTVTETRLKDPRYRQNERLYKIIYLDGFKTGFFEDNKAIIHWTMTNPRPFVV